jgi:hypothetical protein
VWDVNLWAKDRPWKIAGCDVINYAGAAALRLIADRTTSPPSTPHRATGCIIRSAGS